MGYYIETYKGGNSVNRSNMEEQEEIKHSDIKHAHKDKIFMISFMYIKYSYLIEIESRMIVTTG